MCRQVGGFQFCQKEKEDDKRVNVLVYLALTVNTSKEISDNCNIFVRGRGGAIKYINKPASLERILKCSKAAHFKIASYFACM